MTDYLSLDELFSAVGLEQFPSGWTGKEATPVMALPLDYWHPQTALEAWFKPSEDWISEDYINRHTDEEAIARYKEVATCIYLSCHFGEYLAFMKQIDGQLIALDVPKIHSTAFQRMIYHPGEPNRIRLRFLPKPRPAEQPAHMRESEGNIENTDEKPKLTRGEEHKRATAQMYAKFRELAPKYRFKEDGTRRTRAEVAKKIAEDPSAQHPLTHRAPSVENVKRRLNETRDEQAKKR